MSKRHLDLSSARWARIRLLVLDRDGWQCTFCGTYHGRLEVDHIRPLVEAPELAWSLDNLRALCRNCHLDRHRKEPRPEADAWRELMAGMMSSLM